MRLLLRGTLFQFGGQHLKECPESFASATSPVMIWKTTAPVMHYHKPYMKHWYKLMTCLCNRMGLERFMHARNHFQPLHTTFAFACWSSLRHIRKHVDAKCGKLEKHKENTQKSSHQTRVPLVRLDYDQDLQIKEILVLTLTASAYTCSDFRDSGLFSFWLNKIMRSASAFFLKARKKKTRFTRMFYPKSTCHPRSPHKTQALL